MYCDKCGTQIVKGSSFCDRCGKKLIRNEGIKNHRTLICVLIVMLILVLGIGLWLVMEPNKEETQDALKTIEYEVGGEIISKQKYNKKGDIISDTSYGDTSSYKWKYLKKSKCAYYEDGTLAIEVQLNADEKPVLERKYDKYGETESETSYEYYSNGEVSRILNITYAEGSILYDDIYEYDRDGNKRSMHRLHLWHGAKLSEYIENYNENEELISRKYEYSNGTSSDIEVTYKKEGDKSKGEVKYYNDEGALVKELGYIYEYNERGKIIAIYRYSSGEIVSVTRYTYYE